MTGYYSFTAKRAEQIGRLAQVLLTVVFLIAAITFIGWMFSMPALYRPIPNTVALNPISCINLMLLSGCLFFINQIPAKMAKALATVIFVYASFILINQIFRLQIHIDYILFRDLLIQSNPVNRIRWISPLNFMLISLALWMVASGVRHVARQLINIVAMIISAMPFVFHWYRAPEWTFMHHISPVAAFCYFVISCGMLLMFPDKGLVREVLSHSLAGTISRLLLPIAVIMPVLMGYIHVRGELSGYLPSELGAAIMAMLAIVIYGSTVIIFTNMVNRREVDRDNSIEKLIVANARIADSRNELATKVDQLAKANETIARQRDERLNRVIDSTEEVIWSFDLTGKNDNYLSRSASKVFDEDYEVLLNKPFFWRDPMYPDDVPSYMKCLERLENNDASESVFRIITSEGIKWIRNKGWYMRNELGERIRLEGIASDISTIKKSQFELEQKQLQLDAVFNNSHDYFMLVDAQERVITYNHAREQLTREVFGIEMKAGMLFRDTLPLDTREAALNIFNQALAGEVVNVRGMVPTLNSKLVLNSRLSPIIINGKVEYVSVSAMDVTNESKKERELERQRQNLEVVFNRTQDLFILFDASLKVLMLNKRAEEVYYAKSGFKPEVGKSFLDLIRPEARPAAQQLVDKVLQGETHTIEHDFSPADGKPLKFLGRYEPVFTDGKVSHISFVAVDVTSVREKEEAVTDYRKKLELVFENANDFFLLLDKDANMVLFNSPFVRTFKMMTGELPARGTNLFDLKPYGKRILSRESIDRALAGERFSEMMDTERDGNHFYFDVHFNPILEEDTVKYVALTATNITDKMLQENQLREYREKIEMVFEHSDNMFVLIDSGGTVRLYNKRAEEFIRDLFKKEPAIGIQLLDLLPPHRREPAERMIEQCMMGKVAEDDAYIKTGDQLFLYHVIYSPVFLDGKVNYIALNARDVTQQREQEKLLNEYRENLDIIFSTTSDTIQLVDPEGRMVFFNQAYADFVDRVSGKKPEAGMPFVHFKSSKRIAESKRHFREALKGNSQLVEEEFEESTGKKCYYYLRYQPILRDGWVSHVCISGIDISKTKSIENELRQKQYFLDKAADSANIGYWTYEIHSASEGKLNFSKEVYRILELNPEEDEVKAQRYVERMPPGDFAYIQSEFSKIAERGGVVNVDHRFYIGSDRVKWLNLRASLYKSESNGYDLIVGTMQDITERKHQEAALREFNERFEILNKATNDAVGDWDIRKNRIVWNHGLASIFGYKDLMETSFEGWGEYIHPDDKERILTDIQQVFKARRSNWSAAFDFRCADGTYKHILSRAFILYEGQEPIRIIGAMQDVTELTEYRLRLEKIIGDKTRELELSLTKEKDALETQKRFVSIASHEFRTPLSTIMISAGFLKKFHRKLEPLEVDVKLGTIEKQVNHMTVLLDEVLTVGRADAGKIGVKMAPLEIRKFIENAATEARSSWKNTHDFRLEFELDRDSVETDESLMRNVVINLFTNAIKFSPGSSKIDVKTVVRAHQMSLTVKDYGMGISKEDQEKLFSAFFRGSNTNKISGTGLGLSIVKKAVELLKGNVSLVSEPGKGSTFTVILPTGYNSEKS